MADGDAIEWHLTVATGDSVPEFGIKPVRPGHWLYVHTDRIPGAPGRPARAQGMKPNVAPGRYRYQVDLICVDSAGHPDTVVVDPDIYVPLTG